MQKVGDVSKNGRIFQKENRVGYPHPHYPPKPTHTTPFTTTIIITQIVNHPKIIVNLIKSKTLKTPKELWKTTKYWRFLVKNNKIKYKSLYIIYVYLLQMRTPQNRMEWVHGTSVMRIEHFKRDGRGDQIWYYSCLRWGYTKSVPHRDNIIYINTVGYTIQQTLDT